MIDDQQTDSEPIEAETQPIEPENLPIKLQKQPRSLLEFATRPLAFRAIHIYNTQGLRTMQKYLSSLKTEKISELPADIINQIYSVIVKTFNRGDIIFYLLLNLYENLNTENFEDKAKLVKEFLGNFSRIDRALLANYFAREVIVVYSNEPKIIDKNQFFRFDYFVDLVNTLMMYGDISWLAKFEMTIVGYLRHYENLYNKDRILKEIYHPLLKKLMEYFKELYIAEQRTAQELTNFDISDNQWNFAKERFPILVMLLETTDTGEELDWASVNQMDAFIKEINNLKKQDRYNILKYMLLCRVNQEVNFIDLIDVFSDRGDEADVSIDLINMISEYYPETTKDIYINFVDIFAVIIPYSIEIQNIFESIISFSKKSAETLFLYLGLDDNDKDRKAEINKIINNSNSNFMLYTFKHLFRSILMPHRIYCSPSEEILKRLTKDDEERLLNLRNMSNQFPAKLFEPVNNAIDIALLFIKSKFRQNYEMANLIRSKIYALFDHYIENDK